MAVIGLRDRRTSVIRWFISFSSGLRTTTITKGHTNVIREFIDVAQDSGLRTRTFPNSNSEFGRGIRIIRRLSFVVVDPSMYHDRSGISTDGLGTWNKRKKILHRRTPPPASTPTRDLRVCWLVFVGGGAWLYLNLAETNSELANVNSVSELVGLA